MQHFLTQLPKKHKIMLSTLVFFLILLVLIPSENANASKDNAENSTGPSNILVSHLEVGKSYRLKVDLSAIEEPQQAAKATENPIENLTWQDIKVKNGDSLAIIFKKAGFSAQTLFKITDIGESTKILTNIHPGEIVSFGADGDGNLQQLNYKIDPITTLIVALNDDQEYQAQLDTKEVEIRQHFTSAEITSNFWNAAIGSGLNDTQIMNLANIFAWDVDFAAGLRAGDKFSVIYEDHYINGEFIGTGDIIGAEFINQGESYQAVRYTDGEYYTPEGRSMRKAFLRAPVNFKYVSSSFKPKRFHPILKRWKAHKGVDYAARSGTPVVAAGSGKVIRAGYTKYNGNHVFIEHPGGIVTKYLHFSKLKIKQGAKVKQGQLIGLVGATGLAEAPHLHYEFIVNGVHRNPRTVNLPKAEPIAAKERSQFLALATNTINEMNSNKRVTLAYTEPTSASE